MNHPSLALRLFAGGLRPAAPWRTSITRGVVVVLLAASPGAPGPASAGASRSLGRRLGRPPAAVTERSLRATEGSARFVFGGELALEARVPEGWTVLDRHAVATDARLADLLEPPQLDLVRAGRLAFVFGPATGSFVDNIVLQVFPDEALPRSPAAVAEYCAGFRGSLERQLATGLREFSCAARDHRGSAAIQVEAVAEAGPILLSRRVDFGAGHSIGAVASIHRQRLTALRPRIEAFFASLTAARPTRGQ